MTKRKKVGEEALKRLENVDTKQGIVDTQREADKDYFPQIEKCVYNHKHWDTPYYIVVHQKKERLLENVIRRYFIARLSMPTPQWDQTLWRYDPKTTELRFVWTLPDSETAKWMASHPKELSEHHRELVEFITEFLDHRLYSKYYREFNKGEAECALSESSYADSASPVVQDSSILSAEEPSKPKPKILTP